MAAAEFKAKCLKVMEQVAATGEEVVVTKHGRPVVRVVPPPAPTAEPMGWGAGADLRMPFEGDLISPIVDPEDWTGDEDNLFPGGRDG